MKNFSRVFSYAWPHRWLAVCASILPVVSGLIQPLRPFPKKILADYVFGNYPLPAWLATVFDPTDKMTLAYASVGMLIALPLLLNLLHVASNYVQSRLELQIELRFRSQMFEHAMQLSLAYHDRRRSGMLIYIINSLADAVGGIVMTVPSLVQSFVTLIVMIVILLRIDPGIAFLAMVVMPVLAFSVRYYSKHITTRLQNVRSLEGEALSIVHEAISMMRVIVAFCREKFELARYRNQGQRAVDARVDVTVRQTVFSLVVDMTTVLGKAGVLAYGAVHAFKGDLTFGDFLMVFDYIEDVYHPLEAITHTFGSLQEKFIGLKMAFDLLDTEPDVKEAAQPVPLTKCLGQIEFENVDFSYKERTDTLKQISFTAAPGQVVAIVGPTGAGKTTLISLIPRFYEISSGSVRIDGIDVRELALKQLREQVSIVLQEPLLFSTTIKDNIRYGRMEATDEEVIAAAEGANAHEFITRLPQGYDTELGERGARLSGGERQRICVARAFLKDAPILILDEPTSSIDSKTEAVILDALDRLMLGRTTFMIAHRLSTIRKADKILVLDRGRLIEQGTHDELLAKDGLYRQLHEMQNKRAERKAAIDGVLKGLASSEPKS